MATALPPAALSDLDAFRRALGGPWAVERLTEDADGAVRVHYRSLTFPAVSWSHRPDGRGEVAGRVDAADGDALADIARRRPGVALLAWLFSLAVASLGGFLLGRCLA
jgi:hypothetical protein